MEKHENFWDATADEALGYWVTRSPPFSGADGGVVSVGVASYLPNAWGLHDMLGNVREWCLDLDVRVSKDASRRPAGKADRRSRHVRGGSWFSTRDLDVGCAARGSYVQDCANFDTVGFRLVSPLPEKDE